jgi:hypothetical protein
MEVRLEMADATIHEDVSSISTVPLVSNHRILWSLCKTIVTELYWPFCATVVTIRLLLSKSATETGGCIALAAVCFLQFVIHLKLKSFKGRPTTAHNRVVIFFPLALGVTFCHIMMLRSMSIIPDDMTVIPAVHLLWSFWLINGDDQ